MVSSRGTVNSLLQRTFHSRLYKPGAKKGVLIIPGATQDVDFWSAIDTVFDSKIMTGITMSGYAMATLSALSTWGNAAILSDVTTLRTNNQSSGLFASGKVHLVGASMGGTTALNWAKANPTLVASITLIIPCVNIQGIYDENRNSFAAAISTAHGGRPPNASNPSSNAASFTGIPTRLYYSDTDTINTNAEQIAFASGSGAELINMGSIGHQWGPTPATNKPCTGLEIARFIAANDA